MNYPNSYICAGTEYCTYESHLPAPLFRRSFDVAEDLLLAGLVINGLGFYEVHINGIDITNGVLTPYRTNPDHYVYFDSYDLKPYLRKGKNTLAVILGNGLQNSVGGFNWGFVKMPWRGAPRVSFEITLCYQGDVTETVLSDCLTKTAPSPIVFDDLHLGEYYDARLEIPGWDMPDFDDKDWKYAVPALPPRGEPSFCEAEPITVREETKPVKIFKSDNGFVYDFGVNESGVFRLKINGKAGQKLIIKCFETLIDGKPHYENVRSEKKYPYQIDEYICSGKGTEVHVPRFTYHGYRYIFIEGISEEQATAELLTYLKMSSAIETLGCFRSDDEIVNALQEITVRSDISNFYSFPTDCPQREKNGWTADAALSAEQMILNFNTSKSLKVWMRNIYKSINDKGQLPGWIPQGSWAYEWGNGPGWDSVMVEIPYCIYKYFGDRQILEELSIPLMRYLTYLYSRLDENDLIAIGLGDWCQVGKPDVAGDTPLIVSDSILTVDIAEKAAFIYGELGMLPQKKYAETLAELVRAGFCKHLVDTKTGIVSGDTQSGQAMAVYYKMLDKNSEKLAFRHLLKLIDDANGHMNTGVLGGRVLFRVLADNGYAELAYNMIVRTDYPSYGNWIKRGATTLWEMFLPEGGPIFSLNHHFWGDISAWFYIYLAGMNINPKATDIYNIDISPNFIAALNYVNASHTLPYGEIGIEWKKENENILLNITAPEKAHGMIALPSGFRFDDNESRKALKSGSYRIITE